jgi:hypothetical protein
MDGDRVGGGGGERKPPTESQPDDRTNLDVPHGDDRHDVVVGEKFQTDVGLAAVVHLADKCVEASTVAWLHHVA